jgi:hypothetical protein
VVSAAGIFCFCALAGGCGPGLLKQTNAEEFFELWLERWGGGALPDYFAYVSKARCPHPLRKQQSPKQNLNPGNAGFI